MSGKVYFVVAKNLSTRSLRSCRSTDLFEITDDFKYWPFDPKHAADFAKKKDYGIIDEGKMMKHWIVAMTETDDEIQQLLNAGLIKNPVRKSTSATQQPLRLYQLRQEQKQSQSQRAQKPIAATAAAIRDGKGVLSRNKQRHQHLPTRVSPRKKHKAHDTLFNSDVEKINSRKIEVVEKPSSYNKPDIVKSRDKENPEGEGRDAQKNEMKAMGNPDSKHCKFGKPSSIKSDEDLSNDGMQSFKYVCLVCIELKGKVELKEQEIGFLISKCSQLEKDNEELRAERKTLLQLQDKMDSLTVNRVSSPACGNTCVLKDLVFAVELEEEYENFEVPDKEVYIGKGKTVKRALLEKADCYDTLGRKLKEVCKVFWPDGIHFHSLQLNCTIRLNGVKRISDQEIEALTKIMSCMTWADNKRVISSKLVKDSLKHVLSAARTKYLAENPSQLSNTAKKVIRKKHKKKSRKESIEETEELGKEEASNPETGDNLPQQNSVNSQEKSISDLSEDSETDFEAQQPESGVKRPRLNLEQSSVDPFASFD